MSTKSKSSDRASINSDKFKTAEVQSPIRSPTKEEGEKAPNNKDELTPTLNNDEAPESPNSQQGLNSRLDDKRSIEKEQDQNNNQNLTEKEGSTEDKNDSTLGSIDDSGLNEKSENELNTSNSCEPNNVPKKWFKILSIDGGGVRGIIPSVVLQYIEEKTGKPIAELFHMVTGTSTGAILAGILAIPDEGGKKPKYTAKEATNLYYQECPKIFKKGFLLSVKSLKGLRKPRYSAKDKRDVIDSYAGSLTINDALLDILIPAFDVSEGVPYFFRSTSARRDEKYNYKIADILDATSSAPTYFAPCKVEGYDCPDNKKYRSFVDGGLVANTPSLCALADAAKYYKIPKENFLLISLGTGSQTVKEEHQKVKAWGALSWASYFPNSLISASMYTCDYQIKNMLSDDMNYFRVQSNIDDPDHAEMDNVSDENIQWLKQQAERLVETEKKRLDRICELLLQ